MHSPGALLGLMFVSSAWWLGVLSTHAVISAHDTDVLPYLLGTAERPPEYVARMNVQDRKKFKQATCSFGAVGLVSNLARISFQIKNIVELCPKSAEASKSYKPGDEATVPEKVCLLSTTAIFASLAQIARSLTVLSSTCSRTATVAEACAASVETLLIPWSLLVNGGVILSAACDKGAPELPKQIEPGRRLADFTMHLPKARQVDIAQCVFDAVDATRSIASLGLALDAMGRSCPINRATRFTEKLSTAACVVDVSIVLTAFEKLVFFLALAVNHCSPEKERDAICLAGVTAIAAGLTTTSAGGAATWASCEVGRKNRLIRAAEAKNAAAAAEEEARLVLKAAPFNIVRRRLSPENSSTSLMDLQRLEEAFLRFGYNLSDDSADWLQERDSLDTLEFRTYAEDIVRPGL